MIAKDVEMKLARDIARIRLMTKSTTTEQLTPTLTISNEMITAMKELDASKERSLYNEIHNISTEATPEDARSATKLSSIMTEQYIKAILRKLKIRISVLDGQVLDKYGNPRETRKFTGSDYAEASVLCQKEINKATEIIRKAIHAEEPYAIINISAIEAYGYDTEKTKQAITEALKKMATAEQQDPLPDFTLEFIQFVSLNVEAVEHLEKIKYYDNWIYERFCPAGIVKVTINK